MPVPTKANCRETDCQRQYNIEIAAEFDMCELQASFFDVKKEAFE